MSSRISVIIAVKNGERFLARAIESVLAQTVAADEFLVIDGQSTDDTAAVARKFPIQYILQPDDGLANARNLGIRLARGEFIAFLDADDEWHAEKLEWQLRAMRQEPILQYTTTWMQFRLEADAHANRARKAGTVPRECSTPSALMARRALFEQLGGFDPTYPIGCDVDWFIRARDNEIPTMTVPRVLLYKRLHQANLSGNIQQNRQDMFQIAKQSIARQRRPVP
jgi:glycosyltransferase involved in cell wall biosynthesis